jgi:chromosome partitioning protein
MTAVVDPNAPEVVAVVSPTPGSAKTTTAVSLAVALTAAGRTCLLVDLDPKADAGAALVRGRHEQGGAYRLLVEALVAREMVAATEIPDLYLISADQRLAEVENDLALAGDSRTRLQQGLETLAGITPRFDTLILDCPPELGLVTLNALGAAHRVLITVADEEQGREGLAALLRSIQLLRAGLSRPLRGVHLLPVLDAGAPGSRSPGAGLRRRYGRMALQAAVPWDQAVAEAQERSKPLLAHSPRSPAGQAYLALAAEWLTLDAPAKGQIGRAHV